LPIDQSEHRNIDSDPYRQIGQWFKLVNRQFIRDPVLRPYRSAQHVGPQHGLAEEGFRALMKALMNLPSI